MSRHPTNALLRIVVHAVADGEWVAHALECDIRAGGHSPETALDTLIQIVEAHIASDVQAGRTPLSLFAEAPLPLWTMFAIAAHTNRPVAVQRDEGPGRFRYLIATSANAPARPGN